MEGGVICGGRIAATDPTVATGILGVEIADGGGNGGGGATTWIPATDGGTGLESVLRKGRSGKLVLYVHRSRVRGFVLL